jgi:hypothetical protein
MLSHVFNLFCVCLNGKDSRRQTTGGTYGRGTRRRDMSTSRLEGNLVNKRTYVYIPYKMLNSLFFYDNVIQGSFKYKSYSKESCGSS